MKFLQSNFYFNQGIPNKLATQTECHQILQFYNLIAVIYAEQKYILW